MGSYFDYIWLYFMSHQYTLYIKGRKTTEGIKHFKTVLTQIIVYCTFALYNYKNIQIEAINTFVLEKKLKAEAR